MIFWKSMDPLHYVRSKLDEAVIVCIEGECDAHVNSVINELTDQ